jgi:hypothetical protein
MPWFLGQRKIKKQLFFATYFKEKARIYKFEFDEDKCTE